MDTDVSHEVEARLVAIEEFVGMNKEEDEISEETPDEDQEVIV